MALGLGWTIDKVARAPIIRGSFLDPALKLGYKLATGGQVPPWEHRQLTEFFNGVPGNDKYKSYHSLESKLVSTAEAYKKAINGNEDDASLTRHAYDFFEAAKDYHTRLREIYDRMKENPMELRVEYSADGKQITVTSTNHFKEGDVSALDKNGTYNYLFLAQLFSQLDKDNPGWYSELGRGVIKPSNFKKFTELYIDGFIEKRREGKEQSVEEDGFLGIVERSKYAPGGLWGKAQQWGGRLGGDLVGWGLYKAGYLKHQAGERFSSVNKNRWKSAGYVVGRLPELGFRGLTWLGLSAGYRTLQTITGGRFDREGGIRDKLENYRRDGLWGMGAELRGWGKETFFSDVSERKPYRKMSRSHDKYVDLSASNNTLTITGKKRPRFQDKPEGEVSFERMRDGASSDTELIEKDVREMHDLLLEMQDAGLIKLTEEGYKY